jgi:hypothetical protein
MSLLRTTLDAVPQVDVYRANLWQAGEIFGGLFSLAG